MPHHPSDLTAEQVTRLAMSGVPVRTRDVIVLRILNTTANTTIQFGGRVLKQDGTQVDINQQLVLAPNVVVREISIPLLDGWLLSFQVNAQDAAFAYATMYVEAFLSFGTGTSTQRYRTLFSDYLDARSAIAWPHIERIVPGEGPGDIRSLSSPNPAAGAEINDVLTAELKYHFKSLSFTLVTDATAANRRVSLEILEDSGGVVAQIPVQVAQTASLTWRYTFAMGVPVILDTVGLLMVLPIPDMFMNGDYEINTVTQNLQPGDNFSGYVANLNAWAGVRI